jgi:hypothetical protein
MAAEVNVNLIAELTGLGRELKFIDRALDGTAPTVATYNYRVLAVANTAEALDLGDVSTVTGIAIRAIDYDLDIDLDFDTTFNSDLTVKAGELPALIPTPAGTVQVKNNGTGETPAYEYLLWGTT